MEKTTITTKRRIGKTTYIVAASSSDKATDTIDRKIEKLILKDMRENAAEMAINCNSHQ